jgi:hypothetical protein
MVEDAGSRGAEVPSLIEHIKDKSSDVFVTFVSILIGMALADLVEEARARMHLWPLDHQALVTWAQIAAIVGTAMSAWSGYAHLGIARRSVPWFGEAVSATAAPLLLLVVNSFTGRDLLWPWFYAAAMYLFAALLSLVASVHYVRRADDDLDMSRLLHPLSCAGVLYVGVPSFVAAGLLEQRGWLPTQAVIPMLLGGAGASVAFSLLFFRDWRRALAA